MEEIDNFSGILKIFRYFQRRVMKKTHTILSQSPGNKFWESKMKITIPRPRPIREYGLDHSRLDGVLAPGLPNQARSFIWTALNIYNIFIWQYWLRNGREVCLLCALACFNGAWRQTYRNEEPEMTLLDKLGNESAIAFLHTCPRSFNLIQKMPSIPCLSIESVSHHSYCAFDILRSC